MLSFKNWLVESVVLKRTLYRGTVQGNNLQPNKLDNGDFGLGIYMTTSSVMASSFAQQAAKANRGTPVILVIEHSLKNTANFDDPTFSSQFFEQLGIPENKSIIAGQPQTRPYHDSSRITEELLRLGYDSATARRGMEVVAYDESKLRVVDQKSIEDAYLLP